MAEAADLFDVARHVRRLAHAGTQSPHAFVTMAGKLADRIEAIARDIGATPKQPTGRGRTGTITIAGRRVLVQRRRGGFGVG